MAGFTSGFARGLGNSLGARMETRGAPGAPGAPGVAGLNRPDPTELARQQRISALRDQLRAKFGGPPSPPAPGQPQQAAPAGAVPVPQPVPEGAELYAEGGKVGRKERFAKWKDETTRNTTGDRMNAYGLADKIGRRAAAGAANDTYKVHTGDAWKEMKEGMEQLGKDDKSLRYAKGGMVGGRNQYGKC